MRVWAPRAERVDLVDGTTDHPMTPVDGGWWTVDPPAGLRDYGFRLDGDENVRPDPRSRWQPAGVDGPTRVFDPGEYVWGDRAWTGRRLAGSVIYELHIGTFTPEGTLDAAIDKLDHLLAIGVDMVELLPVNAFAGTHNWGYDGVLWFAVQDSYGGPRAYQRFVDACHQRGIGVIQDVVYNHLGAGGNYIPLFGPYLNPTAGGSPWGDSINLDGPDSGEVRRYILDNVVMWLQDYHVDGLRLDAVHALNDSQATHLLEDIAKRVGALSPHVRRPLSLIAESDLNDPRLITPREAGGYGLTAQWNDDFHHVLHVALTGEKEGYYADFGRMSDIGKVLTKAFFHDGTFSSFRGRDHGRPVDTLITPAWRFLGYAQNHDQVGNRAAGDRLTATLSADELAIAAVLVLTAPFTPMLFMGEEWAASTPWQFFTSHTDQFLADATRQGRVEEFARMGWDQELVPDPQARSTFENSKLDWSELHTGRHARLLALYRELAALRRARPELTDPWFGDLSVAADDDERWLVIDRSGVRIVINFADEPRSIPLGGPAGPVLLATTAIDGPVDAGGERLTLPPKAAVVIGPAS
ncbi:malto-oligosyltrehalose trehalohydrolase [Nakamurella sp.]|uniref:malto-oligosyltrehalose trehalohydrolase n=1 Tax=Nakamurella sp. TaxID=1869182 RepID=UPI003784A9E1